MTLHAPSRLAAATATAFVVAVLLPAPPAIAKDRSAAAVPQAAGTWITSEDYPAAALAAGAEGATAIRWEVTAEGRAENCAVTTSSGSADLDRASCALIVERARYVPALDRKGKATRATMARTIRWQLPVEQPQTSVPYVLRPF